MRGLRLGLSLSMASGTLEPGVPFVDNGNTTVVDQGSDFYRITKTAGGDVWGSSGAVGTSAKAGDFLLTIRAGQLDEGFAVGMNADPLTDNDYASIDRGFLFGNDASIYKLDDGAFTALGEAYTTSNYYYVRRVGTTVTLLKNAVDNIGTATLLATLTASAASLYFDCSIFGVGGWLDVRLS